MPGGKTSSSFSVPKLTASGATTGSDFFGKPKNLERPKRNENPEKTSKTQEKLTKSKKTSKTNEKLEQPRKTKTKTKKKHEPIKNS